ncbi:MAG: helix-turn-helix transcriptional regulator, partial [Hylemonella sp.]|nr:helix-turn-helix transcriptional regulator [Hylemonella sp.]
ARDWTVTELAQAVHMSRSVLAQRFAELVDMPPMNYLKQWRLSLAAGMLKNGRNSLARIAERIGYGSEAAFSRAFRQAYGMAPGQWRRGMTMPLDERVAAAAARLH